ncbi:MAG: MBL fold metallo-hydrolase [Minisyncoccia bacterium]|jgi:L-ascorbate metabolism protein UlaG (beta-lactamase superfamily)
MRITKLGHCCLVLEVDGVKILTDPGSYTTAQNDLTGIDIVLITHEHQDHFHAESVAAVLQHNPNAAVVCNSAVAALIQKNNITSAVTVVGDKGNATIKGVLIEGFGKDHALVYPPNMGLCENTGYMVANRFYFPGDNFHLPAQAGQPGKAVDVLALPVAGPWMKMSDCIDFAKAVKARKAFGVHDGMVASNSRSFVNMLLERFVPETEYVTLADGESREF